MTVVKFFRRVLTAFLVVTCMFSASVASADTIEDCTARIQQNPNDYEAYTERGTAYFVKGLLSKTPAYYERAIQDYSKAIQINPNYAAAYNNRGRVCLELNQYELAIQDTSKAIQLDPKSFLAYTNRGWVYYRLKQYERALQDFNRALQINPNNESSKKGRDACLRALGR